MHFYCFMFEYIILMTYWFKSAKPKFSSGEVLIESILLLYHFHISILSTIIKEYFAWKVHVKTTTTGSEYQALQILK